MSLRHAKTLSRRAVLRGLSGVTLALPWLESLMTSRAFAAAAASDKFAIFVRSGNGIVQEGSEAGERFWPRATTTLTTAILRDTNADRATSELAAFAPRLCFIKNVNLPFPRNACGHAEAIVQVLTARNHTGGKSNTPKALGPSADWAVARALNPAGRGPLNFMSGPTNAYVGNALSWSGSESRASAETSPLNAYSRLTGLTTGPSEAQRLLALRRKSVNDLVRGDLNELLANPRLSTSDRRRLSQHLDVVRDLEVGMACDLAADQVRAIEAISSPEGNDIRPEVVRRFMDLAAWAFSCGINHAVSLQVGPGNDTTQYALDGVKLPSFHHISHRVNSDGSDGTAIPNAVELHHRIDRLQLQLFRHLLERLDGYAWVGGGTLLDRTVAAWMNDLGSGPGHSADNVPFILAGGGGGGLSTGKVVDLQRKNVNLVLNTILSAVGVRKADGAPTDDFGDPGLTRGQVPGLLVS